MNSQSAKFDSWKTEYSWSNCKLNNGEYGQFLSSYLRTQKTPLVLNLDGGWGTGKTTFLRQLYCDLHFEHEFPCIYIDAWESDYSNDPLLVIISELLEQLERASQRFHAAEVEKKILAVLGKFGKKLWNTAAIGLGGYLSNKVTNGAFLEIAKEYTFTDAEAAILGTNLTINYKQQKSALTDARQALETLVEFCPDDKKKVFVLIDELDRCRPSYAIEMLETIKHFFELNNYVFVVATDTAQLRHSVNAVYGNKFDGQEYLSRFFSRSAKLPQPNLDSFSRMLVDKVPDENLKNVFCINESENLKDCLSETFAELSDLYGCSLRRLEQTFRKFESIIVYAAEKEPDLMIDANLLIQMLIEFDSPRFATLYEARVTSTTMSIVIPGAIREQSGLSSNNPLDHVANFRLSQKPIKQNMANRYAKYLYSWNLAYFCRREKNLDSKKLYSATSRYRSVCYDSHNEVMLDFLYQIDQLSNINEKSLYADVDDYCNFVELARHHTNL
ncbi:KAP family P-loop NTPase fold protein [Vibrio vulnificus]